MKNARRALAMFAPLLVLDALPSCSEDEPAPVVQPTSAFGPTGPTGAPDGTGSTGPIGETDGGATGAGVPTTTGATPGDLSSGRVSISLAGDIRASKAIAELISAVYAPPPGGMALVWTAGGTDATTFGLGGLSFTGEQSTWPMLSLTLTVQTKDTISTFVSSAGECTVTIGVADASGITGDFACAGLSSGTGEIVDVNGSFFAQR